MRRTIVLGVIVLSGVITSVMLGAQGAPAGQGREAGPGRGAAFVP